MSWGKLDDVGAVKLMVDGAAAGVAAAYMMNEFQKVWSSASSLLAPKSTEEKIQSQESSGDDATVQAARAVSEGVFQKPLRGDKRKEAGAAVHYAFGAAVGALYGVVASQAPVVTSGYGVAYGTVVWLLADEIAVPLVGLSASPISSPLSTHLNALVSHWMYGFTTDLAMRGFVKKIWT